MVEIHIYDIIPLIGIPEPPNGRRSYNISCPCCDTNPRGKHLNINLTKDVFCCPRCRFSGGVFDLYAYYAQVDRKKVREILIKELGLKDSDSFHHEGSKHRRGQRTITRPILQDIELPLTDIDARHETYTALLSKLSLASDHLENLLSRGMTEEMAIKPCPLQVSLPLQSSSMRKAIIWPVSPASIMIRLETGPSARKGEAFSYRQEPQKEKFRACRFDWISSKKENSDGSPALESRTAVRQNAGPILLASLPRQSF